MPNANGSDKGVLEQGEKFEAEIDEIVGGDVGKIQIEESHTILIGPVSKIPNYKVSFEYVGDNYARCLDESVRASNYETRFNILSGRQDEVPISVGEEVSGKIVRSHPESSTATVGNVWVNIQGESVPIGSEIKVRITGFASQSANGELIEVISKKDKTKVDTTPENDRHSDRSTTFNESKERDTRDQNIGKPSREVTEYQSGIVQYSRSREVREYAKDRADGICEGCGSSAPFQDRDGEPYLQVHHIDELSEGGSDDPANVICLCPNCHYRVHHGIDGEEYNVQLRKKVQELESL